MFDVSAEFIEKVAISFMVAQPDSNNVAVFKQDNSCKYYIYYLL